MCTTAQPAEGMLQVRLCKYVQFVGNLYLDKRDFFPRPRKGKSLFAYQRQQKQMRSNLKYNNHQNQVVGTASSTKATARPTD